MKISIVIPLYNNEQYIAECLESVKKQIFTDWECIIIDDGSQDRGREIAEQYANEDSRFRVIVQKNAGVSKAIVTGISVAGGEYFYFLDSDDWLDENELSRLYKIAERYSCDMVASNYYIEKKETTDLCKIVSFSGLVVKEDFEKVLFPILLKQGVACGNTRSGKLIRSSLIKKNIHVQEGMVFAEDGVLMLNVLLDCERVYGLNESAGYHYRRYEMSSSSQIYAKKSYGKLRITYERKVKETLENKKVLNDKNVSIAYQKFLLINMVSILQCVKYNKKELQNAYAEYAIYIEAGVRYISDHKQESLGIKNEIVFWLMKKKCYRSIYYFYRLCNLLRKVMKRRG